MKLSIIIPVYGVEKYILDFANSLFPQTTHDVELIIINDGTKDESINILKKYVINNRDLKLNICWLEQPNQGQSVARNTGIAVAKGQYITFLDPDDIVESNYIETILNILYKEGNKIDILEFNATSFNTNNSDKLVKEIVLCENEGYCQKNTDTLVKLINSMHWFSWIRVFKSSILEKDLFPVGVNFQDMMSLPFLYSIDKNIYGLKSKLVKYRLHSESSVKQVNERIVFSTVQGVNIFKNKSIENEIYIYKYAHFLELNMKYSVKYYGAIKGFSQNRKYIKEFNSIFGYRSDVHFLVSKFSFIYAFLYIIYVNLKKIF